MTVYLPADVRRTSGTWLHRRFALVVACLVAVAAMISGATTAFAADFTVQQGESVRFYFGTVTNVTLEPPEAGTVTVIPEDPGVPLSANVDFTASASFSGVATLRYDSVQFGNGLTTTIQVEGPTASASGSFVPVAAPAPASSSRRTPSFRSATSRWVATTRTPRRRRMSSGARRNP